jgi:hypothetical protein
MILRKRKKIQKINYYFHYFIKKGNLLSSPYIKVHRS